MKNEIQIFKQIQKDNSCTQRDLSKLTGMSLGNVNMLLKRLIEKGLIKTERKNSLSVKYILTLQGKKKWSEDIYCYIMDSYKLVNDINNKLDKIIQYVQKKYEVILLLGKHDEIYKVLKDKLTEKKINFLSIHSIEDKNMLLSFKYGIFLIWNPEFIDLVLELDLEHLNILENI